MRLLLADEGAEWEAVVRQSTAAWPAPVTLERASSPCAGLHPRDAAQVDMVLWPVHQADHLAAELRGWRGASSVRPMLVLAVPEELEEGALAALEEGLAQGYIVVHDLAEPGLARRVSVACQTARVLQQQQADLARQRCFLDVQQQIRREFIAGADLAAVLQLTVDLTHSWLNYEWAAIHLLEPEANNLALVAVAGVVSGAISARAYHLDFGEGIVGQAALQQKFVQAWLGADQAQAWPGLELTAAVQAFSAPIILSGRTVGTVTVAAPHAWPARLGPERELELLAEQLAGVVLTLETTQREAERAERERLLTYISHVANSWLNPSEMLQQAVEAVGQSLRADRAALSLFSLGDNAFVTEHEYINSILSERRSLKRRGPLTEALAQVANILKSGRVILAVGQPSEPGLSDYWDWLVERHGARSLVWVPIPDPDSNRLYTFSLIQVTHARRWTDTEVGLLRAIADQLALALRNAQLFESMRQTAAQLESKNGELEAFVYTVSHDLQAPVVSLRGFASLLQSRYQTVLDERGQSYLARITANAEYLGRLLQDLLELSRVGRREEPDEEFSVQSVVEEALLDLAVVIAERGIEVLIPSTWPQVRYSRTRLRQVFSNLLTNAVKFLGQQAEPQIAVGWRRRSEPEHAVETLEFSVRDNGIGIDPQYHQRIFVPFERLKQVDVPGTGVGLSIVRRIVEGRGGQIYLHSAPGVGTTFYFSIPAVPVPVEEAGGEP